MFKKAIINKENTNTFKIGNTSTPTFSFPTLTSWKFTQENDSGEWEDGDGYHTRITGHKYKIEFTVENIEEDEGIKFLYEKADSLNSDSMVYFEYIRKIDNKKISGQAAIDFGGENGGPIKDLQEITVILHIDGIPNKTEVAVANLETRSVKNSK